MPRYTDSSKDRVRDAVDMVELVGTRTELRRQGGSAYMGRCCFHEERTASLSVDADRKLFNCFGCGVGGDVFTFVRETEGLDFVGALEWLASRYNVELEVADEDPQAAERRRRRERLDELLERASRFYVRHLWQSAEAADARAYLASRGLDEQILREFRVGYAPRSGPLLKTTMDLGYSRDELVACGLAQRFDDGGMRDMFRGRITFTLADPRGRVIGFGARAMGDDMPKYKNSPESEVFHKGDHVFAADMARRPAAQAGETILVEGYTDVLAMHQAGLRNVVASMGTALTDRQVAELVKLAPRVLLALDADAAGQRAMLKAAEVAASRRLELRVVPLPAGRDPADLVLESGPEPLRSAVAASVPFVRFRVERELAAGDADGAEGKDRIVEALRPVFATLPPSALREELLGEVADRLDLAPALVGSWLAPGPGVVPVAGAGVRGSTAPRDTAPRGADRPSRAGDPLVRAERALLMECLAQPAEGEQVLAGLDDAEWASPATARVAGYLRGRLADPAGALPDDDVELSRLVSGLSTAAARVATPVPGAVRTACLELRIRRLDRAIESATRERTPVAALRVRRDALVAEHSAGVSAHHAVTRGPE